VRRGDGPAGRRLAPLRRPDGQERPRLLFRRAGRRGCRRPAVGGLDQRRTAAAHRAAATHPGQPGAPGPGGSGRSELSFHRDREFTMRDYQKDTFTSHDGLELFYRHWPATDNGQPRRALVMFHRGHEHSGRMAHLADELDLPGFDIFAWDARGLGQSPGPRGDSPSFGTSVRDVQTFIAYLRDQHGIAEENMVVLAQSVGAVLVATWAHDYAPNIRALVLASPAFKVKLYVPFARPGLK